ncbi:hypothetical protein DdX_19990 [Ditylenchus destructor]|uniref:Uncharacterized protein n=1 Tax=Ditylenchus destructor TaxID=166010 RepID=A0AAD4MJG8_9BILA|nr:hypothetical protein DdX_19990 [Ditylenchus destructor]
MEVEYESASIIVSQCFNILALLFASTGAVLFLRIAYLYLIRRSSNWQRAKKLSRCMLVHVFFNGIGMLVMTFYCLSTALLTCENVRGIEFTFANLNSNATDAPISRKIYEWLSKLAQVFSGTVTLTVFFVALEQCFAIRLKAKGSSKIKIVLFLCALTLSPAAPLLTLFWNPTKIWHFKLIPALLNTCAFIFIILEAGKEKKAVSAANWHVVRNITAMELCFDCLPNLIAFIIYQLDLEAYAYFEDLPITAQCLNGAICAVIYTKFLSTKRNSRIIPMNTVSGRMNNLFLVQPNLSLALVVAVPRKRKWRGKRISLRRQVLSRNIS